MGEHSDPQQIGLHESKGISYINTGKTINKYDNTSLELSLYLVVGLYPFHNTVISLCCADL